MQQHIAHTPALDLASHGRTKAEAQRAIEEAVLLWFKSCFERGTLEAALKECGFRPAPQQICH